MYEGEVGGEGGRRVGGKGEGNMRGEGESGGSKGVGRDKTRKSEEKLQNTIVVSSFTMSNAAKQMSKTSFSNLFFSPKQWSEKP